MNTASGSLYTVGGYWCAVLCLFPVYDALILLVVVDARALILYHIAVGFFLVLFLFHRCDVHFKADFLQCVPPLISTCSVHIVELPVRPTHTALALHTVVAHAVHVASAPSVTQG